MDNFEKIKDTVVKTLSDAKVNVYDLGGGNHLRVDVVSKEFQGKSLINQHKMIHEILDHLMENRGGFIHALSIKTSVPKD